MNLLVMEHITKGFGDRTLLNDVSLGIQEGDKIGVTTEPEAKAIPSP